MFSICPPGGLFATYSEFTDLQAPGWATRLELSSGWLAFTERLSCQSCFLFFVSD